MSRVLIVEDCPTRTRQIQLLLEDAGFQTDAAGDGQRALEVIGRIPPDIVATDLEMPVMSGLQLVEAIHRNHSSVPVVLITAHGSEEIAALALPKGAASYVPKYHLNEDLVPTLKRMLEVTGPDRHQQRA